MLNLNLPGISSTFYFLLHKAFRIDRHPKSFKNDYNDITAIPIF